MCALLATVLYTLALPPFDLAWLAFLVAAPLAVIVLDPLRPPGRRELVTASLLFGEATTLAVGGHWLYHGAHGFFGTSAAVSLGFTLLTTITHAGAFIAAAVASSAVFVRFRSPVVRALAFACMWVAWEMVRSRFLYGCPWNLLGHALYRQPAFMQAAAWGGAYLLSWLAVACGALLGLAWLARDRPRSASIACMLALGVPVLAAAMGSAGLSARAQTRTAASVAARAPLRVGLVQANVGRHELWNPGRRTGHLDRLLEMSRAPALRGADLIVWAENAVPFLLDADREAREKIAALARELDAFILTGAPRSEQDDSGHARLYNAVYLFSPDGVQLGTYDKVKLLPFIERTPAWAVPFLRPDQALETWPGRAAGVFEVRGWKVAPLICFESTYPELARAAVAMGADMLLNVSNDSWFDRGAAPQQHFAMTLMRAPEFGVPLVRVANTGVSAVIDADGRLLAQLPRRAAAVALAVVPPGQARSVYATLGDVFGWSCVASAFALFVRARRRG